MSCWAKRRNDVLQTLKAKGVRAEPRGYHDYRRGKACSASADRGGKTFLVTIGDRTCVTTVWWRVTIVGGRRSRWLTARSLPPFDATAAKRCRLASAPVAAGRTPPVAVVKFELLCRGTQIGDIKRIKLSANGWRQPVITKMRVL